MKEFVLDAAACLPWYFRDEATDETDHLLQLAKDGAQIYVPSHWPTEILSALSRAVRRKRLDDARVDQFLADLPAYNIAVDAQSMSDLWTEALPLVRLYELSAYDAAYLALAIRLNVPLATLDDKLCTAADVEQVSRAL